MSTSVRVIYHVSMPQCTCQSDTSGHSSGQTNHLNVYINQQSQTTVYRVRMHTKSDQARILGHSFHWSSCTILAMFMQSPSYGCSVAFMQLQYSVVIMNSFLGCVHSFCVWNRFVLSQFWFFHFQYVKSEQFE